MIALAVFLALAAAGVDVHAACAFLSGSVWTGEYGKGGFAPSQSGAAFRVTVVGTHAVFTSPNATVVSRMVGMGETLTVVDVGALPANAGCASHVVGQYRVEWAEDCSEALIAGVRDTCARRGTVLREGAGSGPLRLSRVSTCHRATACGETAAHGAQFVGRFPGDGFTSQVRLTKAGDAAFVETDNHGSYFYQTEMVDAATVRIHEIGTSYAEGCATSEPGLYHLSGTLEGRCQGSFVALKEPCEARRHVLSGLNLHIVDTCPREAADEDVKGVLEEPLPEHKPKKHYTHHKGMEHPKFRMPKEHYRLSKTGLIVSPEEYKKDGHRMGHVHHHEGDSSSSDSSSSDSSDSSSYGTSSSSSTSSTSSSSSSSSDASVTDVLRDGLVLSTSDSSFTGFTSSSGEGSSSSSSSSTSSSTSSSSTSVTDLGLGGDVLVTSSGFGLTSSSDDSSTSSSSERRVLLNNGGLVLTSTGASSSEFSSSTSSFSSSDTTVNFNNGLVLTTSDSGLTDDDDSSSSSTSDDDDSSSSSSSSSSSTSSSSSSSRNRIVVGQRIELSSST